MAELFRSFDSVKTHMGDLVSNKGRSQGGCWTISFPPSHSFLTATHIKWHTKGFWQRKGLESSGGPNGPVTKDTGNRRKYTEKESECTNMEDENVSWKRSITFRGMKLKSSVIWSVTFMSRTPPFKSLGLRFYSKTLFYFFKEIDTFI